IQSDCKSSFDARTERDGHPVWERPKILRRVVAGTIDCPQRYGAGIVPQNPRLIIVAACKCDRRPSGEWSVVIRRIVPVRLDRPTLGEPPRKGSEVLLTVASRPVVRPERDCSCCCCPQNPRLVVRSDADLLCAPPRKRAVVIRCIASVSVDRPDRDLAQVTSP